VSYDDWISDMNTWRVLAEKCAVHGAFSLARDLYGQAISRDPLAYQSSKMWYAFAKASRKCGLLSDSELSLKVYT
jgi:hypothetical protein